MYISVQVASGGARTPSLQRNVHLQINDLPVVLRFVLKTAHQHLSIFKHQVPRVKCGLKNKNEYQAIGF